MRINAEAPVNFAVTALLSDGLRVGPFSVHPPGDRVLRQAGLTSEIWLDWVLALTNLQRDVEKRDLQPTSTAEWELLESDLRPLFEPAMACPGPAALRSRIEDLWRAQRGNVDGWKLEVSDYGGRFWAKVYRLLGPKADPATTFHLVTYPAPVILAVSPTAALLSVGADEDAPAIARRIAASAAAFGGPSA